MISTTDIKQLVFNFSVTFMCAIAGEDYNGSPITANVPAGVTMQPFTINIINNNIIECNEIQWCL